MNAKTQGAVSGAVSGAKAGGIPGAIIGGILGAARAGNAGNAIASQIGKNANGTLQTPAEQMQSPNDQLWGDDEGGDMFATTPDELVNVAQGINNGYGEV